MKSVLVIDDNHMLLKLATTALERAGFRVTALLDFGDFNPVSCGVPDLMLVDIHMPTFYGDDVVTYLKETWNLSAPVFLMSNASMKELEQACSRCGASGYISKEWGVDVMIAQVKTVLG